MDRKTAVAVCSDARFLPAACCQLLSVARHLPSPAAADLYLVCCDVSAEDVDEAERFFAQRGVDVRISLPEAADLIAPLETRWPRAAYLRLYFDSMFGPEYERVIYFDADTRVRAPLAPLLDLDLRGNPVAAAHDFIYYVTGNIRRRRRDLFLAADAPYLQSGVMVFDFPATLADGTLARAREFLGEHPERCREAPDQDALNAALENKWTPLDPRWNLHETYLRFHGRHTPFLEHYTSSKPWAMDRPREWRPAAAWYTTSSPVRRGPTSCSTRPGSRRCTCSGSSSAFGTTRRCETQSPATRQCSSTGSGCRRERDESKHLPWAPPNRTVVERMTDALIDEAAGRRPRLRPPEAVFA